MRKKLDYSKITKREESWLATYMRGFENVETAVSYDFWCGVWILSNVVGRTLTVARPHAPVYLNLYAIICAEAGITRKSTAVRAATTLLRSYADKHDSELAVYTGGISTESLDAHLARLTALWGKSHLALSSSELVSLLGRGHTSLGLPGRLTDLYDCPSLHTRSTIARGEGIARDVYVSLLGASTPSWLVRAINPDVIEGGFTSRCLFIIEEKPKRLVAWPEESEDAGLSDRTINALGTIRRDAQYAAERAGGIRLTRVARQRFTDWYEGRALSSDAFGASFQAREDHHILRLAGILSVSDGAWEIDDHHLGFAIEAIQHVKHTGMALFGTGIAASKAYTLVDRVRGALVSAGRSGLSQSTLSAICRKQGTNDELRDVLAVMHEMNLLQKFVVETGDKGRPATMYRATRAITSAKVLEDVVDQLVPQEV